MFNPQELTLGQEGLDLIKSFEGWEDHSYDDGVGYETIGYGHLLSSKEKRTGYIDIGDTRIYWKDGISKQDGERILAADAEEAEYGVTKLVKVGLDQNQYDALVSWTFNLGAGALNSSTLLKKLNNQEYDAVPNEMRKWTYAGGRELRGLVRRREAEALLWQGKDWRHV